MLVSSLKLSHIERQRGRCGCKILLIAWILRELIPKWRRKRMSQLFERDKYAIKRSFVCRGIGGLLFFG
jgi:hypothetical protein